LDEDRTAPCKRYPENAPEPRAAGQAARDRLFASRLRGLLAQIGTSFVLTMGFAGLALALTFPLSARK